ncbi:MAG: InlB B-repeat-containing protein, partial [Oscillospiraceae bacterium]|nr:InlB B-repeat-containing protein [Oscillospiraceae bacterium]
MRKKARRGLGFALAVLMAFSVMSAGFATMASAEKTVDTTDFTPVVSRKVADPPKVDITIKPWIDMVDIGGYAPGTHIKRQEDFLSFKLANTETQTLIPASVSIDYASMDESHMVSANLLAPSHPNNDPNHFVWTLDSGTATIGDIIKFTISYTTTLPNDPNYTRYFWSSSVYTRCEARNGEAFVIVALDKLAKISPSQYLWYNGMMWLGGTFGTMDIGGGKQLSFTSSTADDKRGSLAFGAFPNISGGKKAEEIFRDFTDIWGGTRLEGSSDNQPLFTVEGSNKVEYNGYTLRAVEYWDANDWRVAGNDGFEDLPELRTWTGAYTPEGHYYYDQSQKFSTIPLSLNVNSSGDGEDIGTKAAQYDGGNPPIVVTRVGASSNMASDYMIGVNDTIGLTGSTKFKVTAGTEKQPNDSYVTFQINRKHKVKYQGIACVDYTVYFDGDSGRNPVEKLNLTIHFYNKEALRDAVEAVQALNIQENWYLDVERGAIVDGYGAIGVQSNARYANYTPYSEFEAAYANAMTVLNYPEIASQAIIDQATSSLLAAVPEDIIASKDYGFYQFDETVNTRGQLLYKPADYVGVDMWLEKVPDEYYSAGQLNKYYWYDEDFKRLDDAVKDIAFDRLEPKTFDGQTAGGPLDIRFTKVLGEMRVNLKRALDGLKYRSYPVNFHGYSTVPSIQTKDVQIKQPIVPPEENPTYKDHIFEGWAEDINGNHTYDEDVDRVMHEWDWESEKMLVGTSIINYRSVNYVPIWRPNALVAHFVDTDTGYSSTIMAYLTHQGEILNAPTADSMIPRTGYTFSHWVDEEGITIKFPVTPTVAEERTYYARWAPKEYDVIFYGLTNGAKVWRTVKNQPYNSVIAEPAGIPLLQGYRFVGWSSDQTDTSRVTWNDTVKMGDGVEDFFPIYENDGRFWLAFYNDIPDGDHFMQNGIFMPDTNLIYDQNEDPMRKLVKSGDTIYGVHESYVPPKPGYVFGGWQYWDELNNKFVEFEFGNTGRAMPSHNLYLYPIFVGQGRTLHFDINAPAGVTGLIDPPNRTRPAGAKLKIGDVTSPTADGYRFDGWYFADGTRFDGLKMPDGEELDFYLTARWTPLSEDNITITMASSNKANGTKLLPNDSVKVDVFQRSTFTVHSNYTIIYYDSTYFEPATESGAAYSYKINGTSTSKITDYITINAANGLWNVGEITGNLNYIGDELYPAYYPPEWKVPGTDTVKDEYKKYAAIVVQVPFDSGRSGNHGVQNDSDTPWFSFNLRVKADAPDTAEGQSADIFFERKVIRDFPVIRNTGMYYNASPASDSYQDVDVVTTAPLQYLVEAAVSNPISLGFQLNPDGLQAPRATFDGIATELILRNVQSGSTIASLKAAEKWFDVYTALGWQFDGWVSQSDYGNKDVPVLTDEDPFTTNNVYYYARFSEKMFDVKIEYRYETLTPGKYEIQSGTTTAVQEGKLYQISDGDFRPAFDGYVYSAEASRLSVNTVMKPEVLYQVFTLKPITFTFDMDGATTRQWQSITKPYGTNVQSVFEAELSDVELYPDLVRAGYHLQFKDRLYQWKTESGPLPSAFVTDLTLKPRWLANKVNISLYVLDYSQEGAPQKILLSELDPSTYGNIVKEVGGAFGASYPNAALLKSLLAARMQADKERYNGYVVEHIYPSDLVVPPLDENATHEVCVGYIQREGCDVVYELRESVDGNPQYLSYDVSGLKCRVGMDASLPLPTIEEVREVSDLPNEYVFEKYFLPENDSSVTPDDKLPVMYCSPVKDGPNKGKILVYIVVKHTSGYYIQFDANGGSGVAPDDQFFAESKNQHTSATDWPQEPALSREGFEFAGWSDSKVTRVPMTEKTLSGQEIALHLNDKSHPIKLYAVWVPIVHFKPEEGFVVEPSQYAYQVDGDLRLSLPRPGHDSKPGMPVITTNTKEGVEFVGWAIDDGSNPSEPSVPIVPEGEITLCAVWRPIQYTIRFKFGSGVVDNGLSDCKVNYGELYTLPTAEDPHAPTLQGYHFVGWDDISSGDPVPIFAEVIYDIKQDYTLTPAFEPNLYTVTFKLPDGEDFEITGICPSDEDYQFGTSIHQDDLPNDREGTPGYDPEFPTATDANGKLLVFKGWVVN